MSTTSTIAVALVSFAVGREFAPVCLIERQVEGPVRTVVKTVEKVVERIVEVPVKVVEAVATDPARIVERRSGRIAEPLKLEAQPKPKLAPKASWTLYTDTKTCAPCRELDAYLKSLPGPPYLFDRPKPNGKIPRLEIVTAGKRVVFIGYPKIRTLIESWNGRGSQPVADAVVDETPVAAKPPCCPGGKCDPKPTPAGKFMTRLPENSTGVIDDMGLSYTRLPLACGCFILRPILDIKPDDPCWSAPEYKRLVAAIREFQAAIDESAEK